MTQKELSSAAKDYVAEQWDITHRIGGVQPNTPQAVAFINNCANPILAFVASLDKSGGYAGDR